MVHKEQNVLLDGIVLESLFNLCFLEEETYQILKQKLEGNREGKKLPRIYEQMTEAQDRNCACKNTVQEKKA